MRIDTARSKDIDAYIKSIAPEKNLKIRVELNGKIETLDVHRFPIKKLIFNIRNGRFASELRAKEEELKRKFNPLDKQDALIIRNLLLEIDVNETEGLREDLKLHGQIDPGIITFDGAVINANRRMAIFSLLSDDTGESRYQYLLAARLPNNVDEKDIWRIEAGLQFGKDFRLKYGPVNELLKLKEGSERGLSPLEISRALLGRFSPPGVTERLGVLKLIDDYLDFTGKPGEYTTLSGDVEKFNSLYGVLKALRKNKGSKSPDIAKIIIMAFLIIEKTKLRHWDVRKLKDISEDKEASNQLLECLPLRQPRNIKPDTLEESFQSAQDIVEDRKEHNKPARLLTRALTAIRNINPKSERLGDAAVQELVKELMAEIKKIQRK
ncbi:MAG: hypothetical protein A3I43_01585 [Omnitrophica WOR_2 bacterium RIFCSPLOWO2_02_FULL_50_19]|nr:MAG: hypothetical protein A3I43_01585 [Omnitrophica WOR_2 bacterium RIFCSPLOWO2_02_FULL_50_19]